MQTLLSSLQKELTLCIGSLFPDLEDQTAEVAPCVQEAFGHYQCNNALRLAKTLKRSPVEIAQSLAQKLQERAGALFAKVEVAPPGFLNLTLSSVYLSKQLQEQLKDPKLGVSLSEKPQRMIVEFSSPNVAKELHVGHIRSTIIGDCLARIFEFLGQDVLRLNHIGDWGTQFGMLIAYLKETGLSTRDLPALMQAYKKAKKQFDEDPPFKKRAQLEVVALQSGKPEALDFWKQICQVSREAFEEIYHLLGVQIQERGESFYNPYLSDVVQELENLGLVTLSEGAKCIFLEGFKTREGTPMPLIIQKSDGGYNYATTDLAALRYRLSQDRARRILVVADVGQSLHFQMVFAVAQKAGWLESAQAEHVGFGLVLGADGKKFKTRSGETEKLIDLLTEAVERAGVMVRERLPHAAKEEVDHLAHVLGIGAIKYADLSSHRTKDYTFSYDRMLRFEGNTAVFLLYAYVRIRGIQRKVGKDSSALMQKGEIYVEHPSEIALGVHLLRFAEILDSISRDLLPNRLADYLYELAEKFNHFFRDCRVEGSAEEEGRLLLCELTARVLQKGLHLLGLQTVERM